MFNRIDCWFKTIWRTAALFLKTGKAYVVEGHVYVETEVHENVTVYISECKDCGKVEISWKK